MKSNRNDIFRCLIIGSSLFIFWGVIIIWIVSYQNLCHALYLTLYFPKYSGVTIIWNSTCSMPWDMPINWNMSSNWHQRVIGVSVMMTSLEKTRVRALATRWRPDICLYFLSGFLEISRSSGMASWGTQRSKYTREVFYRAKITTFCYFTFYYYWTASLWYLDRFTFKD